MALVLGIDIGSSSSKCALVKNRELIGYHILPSGVNYQLAAQELRKTVLAKTGFSEKQIDCTITTGHGSEIIDFSNKEVTDLECCAKGVHYVFPTVRAAIDIQRQSSKVINLDEDGQVTDFAISDICASGSGYFLEVIANVLQEEINEIGPISLKSKDPVTFTTGCAVFGESEAISRLSEGILKEDILAGVHQALADKIFILMKKIGFSEEYAICGGGGLNVGIIRKIEQLGIHMLVPPQPEIINALGAALEAEEPSK